MSRHTGDGAVQAGKPKKVDTKFGKDSKLQGLKKNEKNEEISKWEIKTVG